MPMEVDHLLKFLDIPSIYFIRLDHRETKLAFYYDISGEIEIHTLDLLTKEIHQITDGHLPRSIREKFLWSSDNEYIIYHYDHNGSESYEFRAINIVDKTVIDLGISPSHDQILMDSSDQTDAFTFCSTRNGQLNLFHTNLDDCEVTQITNYERPAWGGRISPDGKLILFHTNETDSPSNQDIYVSNIDGTDHRKLVSLSSKSREIYGGFSQNGKKLSFSTDISGYYHPAIYDIEDNTIEYYSTGRGDEYALEFAGDDLLVLSNHHGTILPAIYNTNTKERNELEIEPGLIDFIALSHESLYFVNNTSNCPSKLGDYNFIHHSKSVLIDPTTKVEKLDCVQDQHIWYSSPDDHKIPAIVYFPKGHETNGKSPGMVVPHGGPSWNYFRNYNALGQMLSHMGYISIFPNVRGSTGYGKEFRDACIRDWGGKDLLDWVGAHQWLIENGADRDRIGIYGESYGGFAVLTCLGRYPQLWKAGIAFAPLTDFFTTYDAMSDNYKYWIETQMGTPEAAGDLWEERSPINFCDKITAPLLLIHGTRDPRFSVAESRNFFDRLKQIGKVDSHDIRYIELEDQGHSSSDKSDQKELFRIILEFVIDNV